ncbi:cell division protein FtsQ [Pigmentiphaga aceris]|uniref:Alginate biosynthesis protein AlgF n=1 Tax=Pigmentiphaga aceris TaxID=1940612 RepID=A0A5C0AY78_9BURK|nr:alginate O-acetyltransferase AlgF [Pigmentiphaga aceris]QEI07409.1 cell division protein FtsQ [Pigmentiphaga aceris]
MIHTFSRLHRAALAAALLAAPFAAVHAADIPLYPTGPSEDSSFVRFVNTGDTPISLEATGSKATLALPPSKPASDFQPVAANKALVGTFTRGTQRAPIDVTVKPGEFATVFGFVSAKGEFSTKVVRELPEDFNALRASLAFYNLDSACPQAGLKPAGRDVAVFSDVPVNEAKRRFINPVALSVQLVCAGKPQGEPLALGSLAPGQRYSVFAVPSANGTRVFFTNDALAN